MALTYEPIATVTTSGVSTFVVMSSIPATYTDLVLVGRYIKTTASSARITLNADTGSNYSQTDLYNTSSGRETSVTRVFIMNYVTSSTTEPNASVTHIMNYSNTTTYKTLLDRSGRVGGGTVLSAMIWRNTGAINRIDIDTSTGTFSAGTTFTLYGITAA